LVTALWAWRNTHNVDLLIGIVYFVLMEALQGVQYMFIDDCANVWNQRLTVIGFLHICFQPYVTHLLNGAFMRSEKKKAQFDVIRRLAFIGGAMMFSRYLLWTEKDILGTTCPNTDWVRGDRTCTYFGNHHLAWELPLKNPTYYVPSNNIHFFMMFAPFFVMEMKFWINGLVLLLTGPVLAAFITPNLHEQASIWCFFSIAQVFLVVVMLRMNLKPVGAWGADAHKQGKQVKATPKTTPEKPLKIHPHKAA